MPTMESVASRAVRAAGSVSPELAGALALELFMHVGRRAPLRAEDAPMMERARGWDAQVPGVRGRGASLRVHEWGGGPDAVVLVHGWQGRASQFVPLVKELVAEGFRVVAFDAPAHGSAPGRRTYLMDWIDGIRAVQARHGALHGLVGHSLGGLAAMAAVGAGVQVRRVVTVAAPADTEAVFRGFRARLGHDARVDAAFRRRFVERYFDGRDPSPRLSAIARPLPESVRVLVAHDAADRVMPLSEAARLRAALPDAAVLDTRGEGHSRILRGDRFLDAAVAHLTMPDEVVPVRSADASRARSQGAAA